MKIAEAKEKYRGAGSFEMEGEWVDARGVFLGGAYASPVYDLHGKRRLGTYQLPPIETPLIEGESAFRQHRRGNTTGLNLPTFLEIVERYFR